MPHMLRNIERYEHILAVLFKYGFEELAEALNKRLHGRLKSLLVRVEGPGYSLSHPERVRLALQEAGPTFVKLGQILSTRHDLIPPQYVAELAKLQDRVEPAPFAPIRHEVESQLGRRLEEVFTRFDPTPLASASIAQVHRATLTDGREVAVKVRRPNIVETVHAECEILRELAGLYDSVTRHRSAIDPARIVREFTRAVWKEVSLANERRNQLRFMRNYAGDETVHIARVMPDYCADGVLTMEYIHGVKPTNIDALRQAGLDPLVLATRVADMVLGQIFKFKYFHADPHPGNIFCMAGNVVCPIDFGQVARLTPQNRRLLNDLIMSIADRDTERMIATFQREEMIDERTDLDSLYDDANATFDTYYDMPEEYFPFSEVMHQNLEMIRKHHIRAPAEFSLVLKALITTESLVLDLNPDFLIVRHLKRYALRLRLESLDPRNLLRGVWKFGRETASLLANMPEHMRVILRRLRDGKLLLNIHVANLSRLISVLHTASNRLSGAMIIAALVLASSLLVEHPGTVFGVVDIQSLGIAGYSVAGAMGLMLMFSMFFGRGK